MLGVCAAKTVGLMIAGPIWFAEDPLATDPKVTVLNTSLDPVDHRLRG